jgi:sarcosine dehydrogenase
VKCFRTILQLNEVILGTIKTNTVVNATGVWGKDLLSSHGIHLPLVPMKHAYVISETIKDVQGMPNVRDHDYSLYFRIQGQSIWHREKLKSHY